MLPEPEFKSRIWNIFNIIITHKLLKNRQKQFWHFNWLMVCHYHFVIEIPKCMLGKTNIKIFIVDDDRFFREVFAHHLKRLGFEHIHVFENGEDCIEQLSLQPDIIFTDYHMSPINGIDLIKKIRSVNDDVYLLLVSSQKEVQIVLAALDIKAAYYIAKNTHVLEMIEMVAKNISNLIAERRQDAGQILLQNIYYN